MLRRVGLVALIAAPAAFANKCYQCDSTTAITNLDGADQGKCYFTSLLTDTDKIDCTGACYVKYTSEDGILTTVERGCIANDATSTTDAATVDIGIEFIETDFATDLATGTPTRCVVDTEGGTGAALTHFDAVTQTWAANNFDQNRLTDLTCAKTCPVNGDNPCNAGTNFEVETLTDCGGKCNNAAVCTCDHWTGDIESKCTTDNTQRLFTLTPTTNNFYTCETYVCDPICDVTGTSCLGSGVAESDNGQCRCSRGTVDAVDANLYIGGETLQSDDTCASVCSDCDCPSCQCTHSLFASSGTCRCTGLNEVYSTADGTCSVPTTENTKCQQCSSDIETGNTCASGTTTATACANANERCAAVSTIWVNAEGNSIREVVERGCTADPEAYDTCEFQTVSSTLNAAQSSDFDTALTTEITCRYVCSGDDCNSELADGTDTTAEPTMSKCNVGPICAGIEDCKAIGAVDFATDVAGVYTADTDCPNIDGRAAMCVGMMTYLEHMRYDGTIERAMNKLEYRCEVAADSFAEEGVKSCETNNIGYQQSQFDTNAQTDKISGVRSVIQLHSCTTACTGTNCNNAWPGQPTCYTCNDDSSVSADHCYTDVNMAAPCSAYHNNACFVKQSGLDLESNWAVKSVNPYSAQQSMGAYRAIMRGCTTASLARTDEGTAYTRDGEQNQVAYVDRMVVCKEDGCNFGPALPTPNN